MPGIGFRSPAGLAVCQSGRPSARGRKRSLFVLTTQTAHWFRERGFEAMELQERPMEKQRLYNFRRNSKVFAKAL